VHYARVRIDNLSEKGQTPKKRESDQLLKEVDDLIALCRAKIKKLDASMGPLY